MQDVALKRNRLGGIASVIGIVANVIIAVFKIVIGSLFGVISVLADGLNNLTDCGNSIISVISFRLSSRPADKEHPYGHERIEYVCSLAVAFLILLVAFDTARESIGKIISPSASAFSFWIILALGVSVIVKTCLFFYYRWVAKRIDSSILRASAVDCLTDCISTTVVAISVVIYKVFGVDVDGYAGIVVAIFIAWSGVGVLKEIFSKLIGQAPDQQMIDDIKNKIKAYDGVLDVHDLSVYSYGPNKYFASVHIEVDANVDVLASHELIDHIEKDFYQKNNIILTGHLDPIVIDNEEVNCLKVKVERAVKELDEQFSIHDFRVVFGQNNTNVLFDVAIPFDSKLTKEEISIAVKKAVKEIDQKYTAVITVEHCM